LSQRPPGLWIEPRWSEIHKQGSPEDQYRYAQFAAPRDEWAAAWLAVPGKHPRTHEATSKAYVQLARLWYRRDDVEALAALGTELEAWKQSQRRDKELAALIRLALDLKKGDLGAVEQGFAKLSDAEVADMYDASLVAFNLEVCADALKAFQNKGTQTIEEPLRRALRRLIWHINRIEIGGPAGPGRVNPGAAAGPRSGG
jgi:ATP/maltotriose-dependent transcriptional regulator MalT